MNEWKVTKSLKAAKLHIKYPMTSCSAVQYNQGCRAQGSGPSLHLTVDSDLSL